MGGRQSCQGSSVAVSRTSFFPVLLLFLPSHFLFFLFSSSSFSLVFFSSSFSYPFSYSLSLSLSLSSSSSFTHNPLFPIYSFFYLHISSIFLCAINHRPSLSLPSLIILCSQAEEDFFLPRLLSTFFLLLPLSYYNCHIFPGSYLSLSPLVR